MPPRCNSLGCGRFAPRASAKLDAAAQLFSRRAVRAGCDQQTTAIAPRDRAILDVFRAAVTGRPNQEQPRITPQFGDCALEYAA